MTAVVWLLAAVVALLALLVVGLLRSHAEILRALHDAGISLDPDRDGATSRSASPGAPEIRTRDGVAPPAGITGRRGVDISGLTPAGSVRSVSVGAGGGATLLAFLTTGCATCADFWSAFADGVELRPGVRLVVVTKGPDRESPADVAALAAPHVTTVQSSEAWDDYSVPVAPYFVFVDGRSGLVVGEGAAASWPRVQALLDRALADAGYTGETITRRSLLAGRARQARIDRDLLDAGITPGDPRLYHDPAGEDRDR